MIRIKQKHMDMLSNAAFRDYVRREILSVRRTAQPWLFEMLGEEKMFEETYKIAKGIEASGWIQRGPIRFYSELYMELGIGMETDPQYKWIKEFRTQQGDTDEITAAVALEDEYIKRFAEVEGENKELHRSAIEALNRLTLADLPQEEYQLSEQTKAFISKLYPTRWKFFDAKEIDDYIEEGLRIAKEEYHFHEAKHRVLVVLMRLFLGHQCWCDPFTPWAHPQRISYNIGTVHVVDDSKAVAEKYWKTMQEILIRSLTVETVE